MMSERLKDGALYTVERPIAKAVECLFKKCSTPIESLFDINMNPLYLDEIVQQALDGASIIFVGNHQSSADIIPMGIIVAKAINAIRQNPGQSNYPDVIVPIAASVLVGKQSVGITAAYGGMSAWLKDHAMRLIPVVTERDANIRGMEMGSTIGNVREVMELIKTGTAVALFPEASVQGGRRKSKPYQHERNGIQPILKQTLLSNSVLEMRSIGKKLLLVGIGFSGTYNIFDPDTLHPTQTAILAFVHNFRHPNSPTHVAKITVGKPIMADNLPLPELDVGYGKKNRTYGDVHELVFRYISELIPFGERGVFK